MAEIVRADLVSAVSNELHMDKLEAEVVAEGVIYDRLFGRSTRKHSAKNSLRLNAKRLHLNRRRDRR